MAHCIRPVQFVPISKVVDEVCYRPRADEVDAERLALSEIRRQVFPDDRARVEWFHFFDDSMNQMRS